MQLDGTNVGSDVGGIRMETGSFDITVRGMAIINYTVGITGGSGSSSGFVITACHIGVRADGTTAAGNEIGVAISGSNHIIGGTGSDDGNIISGNNFAGVSPGNNNTIQGNFIGTNPSGKDLGNGKQGINLGSVGGNLVGGTASGAGNVIAYNGGDGVTLFKRPSNTIRQNQIFANDGLGIDLANDGPTANDGGDGDDGTNELQNFPEIQNADYDASANEVIVTYQVPSDPNSTGSGPSAYDLMIDFYRAETSTLDAEGEVYLGSDTYTTSDYNTSTTGPDPKTITFTPAKPVSDTDSIVATATDANGNTSEFSAQSKQLPVELASFNGTATEGSARLTWQTASETGNAGFEVQRRVKDASAGARQKENEGWTEVGYVESKASGGTTTETQSYSFLAKDLPVGTHQFRLRQVDLDGSSTFMGPVAVDIRMQEAVSLKAPAPNPARGTATVAFAVKERVETRIRLYTSLGQQVATVYEGTPQAGERQTVRIDAGGLPSGTYFLRLRADGQTRTQRLTVVR
ncbi:MAG: T9SS type A sorting domain-containing protein [Salinibacter sp.]|uniref:T9SS type A sorting domain-containing protein n=1 Tax=Salinibacter sp. TaxID=2065818 RepID=UPI0035D3FED9